MKYPQQLHTTDVVTQTSGCWSPATTGRGGPGVFSPSSFQMQTCGRGAACVVVVQGGAQK